MLQLITLSVEELENIVERSVTKALSQRPTQTEEEILTIKEASAFLKIKPSTLYDLCASGEIPYSRPAKSYLFMRSELLNWLEGHKKGGE